MEWGSAQKTINQMRPPLCMRVCVCSCACEAGNGSVTLSHFVCTFVKRRKVSDGALDANILNLLGCE